jgi:hypothetical protein
MPQLPVTRVVTPCFTRLSARGWMSSVLSEWACISLRVFSDCGDRHAYGVSYGGIAT